MVSLLGLSDDKIKHQRSLSRRDYSQLQLKHPYPQNHLSLNHLQRATSRAISSLQYKLLRQPRPPLRPKKLRQTSRPVNCTFATYVNFLALGRDTCPGFPENLTELRDVAEAGTTRTGKAKIYWEFTNRQTIKPNRSTLMVATGFKGEAQNLSFPATEEEAKSIRDTASEASSRSSARRADKSSWTKADAKSGAGSNSTKTQPPDVSHDPQRFVDAFKTASRKPGHHVAIEEQCRQYSGNKKRQSAVRFFKVDAQIHILLKEVTSGPAFDGVRTIRHLVDTGKLPSPYMAICVQRYCPSIFATLVLQTINDVPTTAASSESTNSVDPWEGMRPEGVPSGVAEWDEGSTDQKESEAENEV